MDCEHCGVAIPLSDGLLISLGLCQDCWEAECNKGFAKEAATVAVVEEAMAAAGACDWCLGYGPIASDCGFSGRVCVECWEQYLGAWSDSVAAWGSQLAAKAREVWAVRIVLGVRRYRRPHRRMPRRLAWQAGADSSWRIANPGDLPLLLMAEPLIAARVRKARVCATH